MLKKYGKRQIRKGEYYVGPYVQHHRRFYVWSIYWQIYTEGQAIFGWNIFKNLWKIHSDNDRIISFG